MLSKVLWPIGKRVTKGEEDARFLEAVHLAVPQRIQSASNDAQLEEILQNIKATKTSAVINYGASWCRVCSQILPVFCRLSNEFRKLPFIYADIDECPNATQAIRYTPTFHFYRDGEKVDEMFGIGEERLRDRLWLHS
ncbi:Thioredoxin-like 3-3 [Platanthera zijinensis]|uniref:Thioredoxin-like 3-3 n=1 Tax=Platanthera zijinensis TaxID=2320716 RepID=A0AAP0BUS1_9ASPA